jgi:energy-coupling factor transporter ATP-binding protein EcfA2
MNDGVRPASVRARGWSWRHADRPVAAVANLDLDIAAGERVLLVGPSGAGKSTLLHALAGVLGQNDGSDETGSLLVDGAPPAAVRGRAGLMQQDPEAQVVLSRVGDDVAFGAENLQVPPEEIWRRVGASLEAVGLRLPLDAPTSALSGGQKQRLGLAGLLAMQPGLLLLDEPTANLDPAGVLDLRDAVVRLVEHTGATLIVVEHRVPVWLEVVDRIIVLAPGARNVSGGVLFDGRPQDVLGSAASWLAGEGIWVPGHTPAVPARRNSGPGGMLLQATELAVSRQRQANPSRRPSRFRRSGHLGRAASGGALGATPGAAGGQAFRPAVAGLSFPVLSGQALSITGANGSGKSTLALTLGGLLPPVAGTVAASPLLARGERPDPYRWKGPALIERIGSVFQEPEHQFITGTVLDELRFGPAKLGHGMDRVEELLERLHLTHLAEANPFTLSGGEKRRLSVATVLATSPQLLVLDEPTFGQDATTWAELAGLLRDLLDEGTAVVSVTHDSLFTQVLGGARLDLPDDGGKAPAAPVAVAATGPGTATAAGGSREH